MIPTDITKYVQQCRELKIPESEIGQSLLGAGWAKNMIEEALEVSRVRESLIIEVKNVSKEYSPNNKVTIPALKDINLKIHRGEFIAITGPSGSGKSTLLNLISLTDEPTTGEIILNGTNISHLNEKEKNSLRLSSLSIIFQFLNLLDNYTALENISFQLRLQNQTSKQSKEKSAEILDFLGLREKAGAYPNELSGGEQQRIAIGRALAKNSNIILADEPTAHLDSKNSQNVISLLKDINQWFQKTIILVTHELNYAEQAQRIVALKDGQIVKDCRLGN